MIVYSTRLWGIPLLFRAFGSPFPRCFMFASLSSLTTALLYYYSSHVVTDALKNPFGYQIFCFVVGFALVFRSSLAYNRWWEGRTLIQTMSGKITYFFVEVLSIDTWCQMERGAVDPEGSFRFAMQMQHLCSLLFVLMMKQLRRDYDLSNIYEHDPSHVPPRLDAAEAVVWKDRFKLFMLKLAALDELGFELDGDPLDFDMPAIGGVSPDEREALLYPVGVEGLQGDAAKFQNSRAFICYCWIMKLFHTRQDEGGLRGQAPTVARVLATLQDVMAAFGQAVKLSATPFPFPWAQVVPSFLLILIITLPFVTVSFTGEAWIGIMLTFMIVVTYMALNEIALEMEDPFGNDPNDLPLPRFVFDLNQNLVVAGWQLRAPYFDNVDPNAKGAQFAVIAPPQRSFAPKAKGWQLLKQRAYCLPGSQPHRVNPYAVGGASGIGGKKSATELARMFIGSIPANPTTSTSTTTVTTAGGGAPGGGGAAGGGLMAAVAAMKQQQQQQQQDGGGAQGTGARSPANVVHPSPTPTP